MPDYCSIQACAIGRLKTKRDQSFVAYRGAAIANPAAIERFDVDSFTRVVRSELDCDSDDFAGLNADLIGEISDRYTLTITELNGRDCTCRCLATQLPTTAVSADGDSSTSQKKSFHIKCFD